MWLEGGVVSMQWEGARVGLTGALREMLTWLEGTQNGSMGAEGVTLTLFEGLNAVTLLSISSDLAVGLVLISIATVFEAPELLTPSFPASPINVASGALLIG